MKYKNIVFDFGNVIGKFDGNSILHQFYPPDCDFEKVFQIVFRSWNELDKGTIDYWGYADETAGMLSPDLSRSTAKFFRQWPEHLVLIDETLDLIDSLKKRHIPVYLLSNAPVYFAEWAIKNCAFLDGFNGIVFSAPLKTAKPEPQIYNYLFGQFGLIPQDCFFIDDLMKNIDAGRSLGMDGIVFTGDINKVKAAIDF